MVLRNPGRPPTDQHLMELHHAYQDYMAAKPWREMTDRNPFMVTNPENGEEACCIAMGHWGLEYGVAMYLEPGSIGTYRNHGLGLRPTAPVTCRLLGATTGHRNLVDMGERPRLRSMGISYGEDRWPIWFRPKLDQAGRILGRNVIDDQDAVILAAALRAAADIALQARLGAISITTDERPTPPVGRYRRGDPPRTRTERGNTSPSPSKAERKTGVVRRAESTAHKP